MTNGGTEVWYIPRGKKTVFSAIRVDASVDGGVLKLREPKSPSDVASIDLRRSLTTSLFGQVFFKHLDGDKAGMLKGPWLYLYNPKVAPFAAILVWLSIGKARAFSRWLNSYSAVASK